MQAYGPIDSDQEKYSLLDRKIETDGTVAHCREHGIGILAYSPLANGLLTGKIRPDRQYGPGDLRKANPRFMPAKRRAGQRHVGEARAPGRRAPGERRPVGHRLDAYRSRALPACSAAPATRPRRRKTPPPARSPCSPKKSISSKRQSTAENNPRSYRGHSRKPEAGRPPDAVGGLFASLLAPRLPGLWSLLSHPIPLSILDGPSCRRSWRRPLYRRRARPRNRQPSKDQREIMLKVILPDGSVLEFSRHVRPIDIAAQIGPRLAKATLAAEVDGQLRRGRRPPARRRADSPAAADGQGPGGPGHLAAFVRPRDGPGGDAAVRGRATGLRPDGGQRFLLRFSDGARPFGGGFSADRGRDGADRRGKRALRAGGNGTRRGPAVLPGPGPVAQGGTPRRGPGRGSHRVALSPGRVRRSVPRAARARRRGHRGLQTALRRRRLLEGRRPAAAVAAALRHRLVHQAGPRRLSAAGRRGQAARSSRAGKATGAVPDRSGRRLRAGAVAAQGGGRPPATGELPLRRAAAARLPAGLHAGHRQRPLVRDFRPFSLLQGQPVPAHRVGRGRALLAAADELPASRHDLQVEAAELPRAAAAAGRVRHGAPLRAVGRTERHDPGPRLHAGRRPHFLHRRPGGRRIPRLPGNDPLRAADAGAGRLSRAAGLFRPGQRQVRGQPRRRGSGRKRPWSRSAATWTCPT